MTGAPNLLGAFPFPFSADQYRYSTDIEPAGTVVSTTVGRWGERIVDVDDPLTPSTHGGRHHGARGLDVGAVAILVG